MSKELMEYDEVELARAAVRAGYSRTGLAKAAGVSPRSVDIAFAGNSKPTMVGKLCAAIGIDMLSLYPNLAKAAVGPKGERGARNG